jgi:hypothetical protein
MQYPEWAGIAIRVGLIALAIGGCLALFLATVGGLLHIATRKPHDYFILGGILFIAAIALQFWSTFYPAE